ncbi:MAG: helix-turn-helix transcriptional regulator [Candidatus Thorarchaeota archaeon]|nr:helix-turn-helix transcriptional regulator [Candidatus Thorarchaeota archaeon]
MAAVKKKTQTLIEFEDNELDDVIDIFKALSDHSRVRIISALTRKESLCVSDIAEVLDMPISRVSHHLSTLKMLGFVRPKQEGKQVFYSIDDDCITDIMKRARDHVAGK